MKKRILFSLVISCSLIFLFSCKKEVVNLDSEDSEIRIYPETFETFNLYNNILKIKGELCPYDFTDETVKLKVFSDIDTGGFILEANLGNGFTQSKGIKTEYKLLDASFSVSNKTVESLNCIKISPICQNITVKVLNSNITASYSLEDFKFDDVLHLSYYDNDNKAYLNVYSYDSEVNNLPEIVAYSDISTPEITLTDAEYLSDAINHYRFEISFALTTESNQESQTIAVDDTDDFRIYFKYNGSTYYSNYSENSEIPLKKL